MEQNHRKKLAILPERDNRHVRKRDDIADFGIEMEIDRGYSSAARFMEKHGIRPDTMERVLRERLGHRNHRACNAFCGHLSETGRDPFFEFDTEAVQS